MRMQYPYRLRHVHQHAYVLSSQRGALEQAQQEMSNKKISREHVTNAQRTHGK